MLNAFTVDVEDYFHVAALSSSIDRKDWSNIPPRVDSNTRRLLDIFDSHGARATFFVLGWVAERFPELIKEIHRRGHEVACHGFSHTLVYEQSPEQFETETVRAKGVLEELIGAPVAGYRAASYSITSKSLWALDIIVANGFKYDSSIFPVRHDLYGIPGSLPMPHRLETGNGTLVEFPPTTVRLLHQNVPVGGGGYFRLYPYAVTKYLLERVRKRDAQPFIFYIHPWEIDPDQPRVHASFLSTFRHYLNLDKCETRLVRLLEDFRFATVRTVLEELELLA
jgi:polysaccharide deacetylase family protein (PEP-CTERM system associated)